MHGRTVLARGTESLQIRRWREMDSNPGFLREKATKTSEKVLIAPTQETWIGGVSTRQVDNRAGDGLSGISSPRFPSSASRSQSSEINRSSVNPVTLPDRAISY